MASKIERLEKTLDSGAFLATYPEFDLRPRAGGGLSAVGTIDRLFQAKDLPSLHGRFELVVEIPLSFPDDLPVAYETGGVIGIDPEYHRNKDSVGSFCLETPLRVKMAIRDFPTLAGVLEHLVFPFLYRFLYREEFGAPPPGWGEVDHYDEGRRSAYRRLLRVKTDSQLQKMLRLLSLPESMAARKVCFCGTGRPIVSCHKSHVDQVRTEIGLSAHDFKRELESISWVRKRRDRGRRRR